MDWKRKLIAYIELFGWCAIGVWLLAAAYGFLRDWPHYDDTDDVLNGVRSNMVLYTDHGTGCQYLGKFWGGLTPRLDEDGNQICN